MARNPPQNLEIWKVLCPHCSVSESAILRQLTRLATWFNFWENVFSKSARP